MKLYFTRSEILMGRDTQYPISTEQSSNLDKLIIALSKIRDKWGKPLAVSSGYRPSIYNSQAGGASKSAHLTCEAADIIDKDGKLADWLLKNLDILIEAELYLEDPRYTKVLNTKGEVVAQWTHLQTRPTSKRVFIPYSGPIKLKVV